MNRNIKNTGLPHSSKPDDTDDSFASRVPEVVDPVKMARYLEYESERLFADLDGFRLKLLAAKELGCDVKHINAPPPWEPLTRPVIKDNEVYYSRDDAATFLRISPRTLANYIKQGKIEEIKYSERRRAISATELERFAKKGI